MCGASRLCLALLFALLLSLFPKRGWLRANNKRPSWQNKSKKCSAITCVCVWAPNTLFSRTCAWFFHAVAAYSACVTSLGLKQQLASTTAWVCIGTLQYIYVSMILCVCVSCEVSSCLCEYVAEGSKMVDGGWSRSRHINKTSRFTLIFSLSAISVFSTEYH